MAAIYVKLKYTQSELFIFGLRTIRLGESFKYILP